MKVVVVVHGGGNGDDGSVDWRRLAIVKVVVVEKIDNDGGID